MQDSLLFRSVELKPGKCLLGWDDRTFESTNDSIVATGVNSSGFGGMKLKFRTGGSTRQVDKSREVYRNYQGDAAEPD